MPKPRLILVLGDQLSPGLSALRAADPARDLVVMAEGMGEGTSVPHHPQKIALILSAMRHFAKDLQAAGWRVAYSRLDDPANGQTLVAEILRRASEVGAGALLCTHPGEWRVLADLQALPLDVSVLPDDRFLCSHAEFAAWAEGRKELRMEWFYREMRRRTGLLMQGDTPAGGQWNFDAENRKRAERGLLRPQPLRFAPDAVTDEVLALVEARFAHFGTARPFGWPVTRVQALEALADFAAHRLPSFGAEQDAMLEGEPWLSHSLLSAALNIGLLGPLEVCRAVEDAWRAGKVPLNAAEGFIRQIIGWREYVRGIWALKGPEYLGANALGHSRALPAAYWDGETRMACLGAAVAQTRDLAYAHHIQRLMVTGNFALLAGVDPAAVHEWYLSVYIDAFEWVEAPNTLGMSQWADGGVVGSKPYVSSGAYIDRMSDHCRGCGYKVAEKTGEAACPFNLLYWQFLDRHRARFVRNPRMAQMYRTWDRMDAGHRARVLADAAMLLTRLDRGEAV
ncbi:cryptochrome/photolyase family protein [Rhodobacter sp. Har01]|uniref:cryptochrome/photolyase family protein n=1 Tax=Rhodobacter sp. Har01 TaxID=2883999 RepID=UPI001D05E677|nr:cryptochrome/photolyase family protein [Rhodobacter sp. Har01]MCB6178428.1 cryptochrome/photolyase family protein [Rhodobacter sp. Har01]